ncbi:ABC transporter [Plectonema cf. radiosum LEGE 06105]|uniref:ABC transporter n=1 Tax=Plectonema cf. radiosum LEGE 06105 TaxID=945769 RepID=A0A8J7F5F5_9CYAN|nr:ABC transporter permease DevC [Plectonema radiosum]MBE9214085.1 ABC transporter [Plectonema cf. radiosum LEGE 06105]
MTIPVAWLQLTQQRVRFLATLAGVSFVVILIFMQFGFQDALYNSATQLHQNLKGDLFIISSQYNALTSQQSFPRNRLFQTLAFNGVESVSPVYLQFAKLKNPYTGKKNPIYVIGFDPAAPAFNLPEVNQLLPLIQLPDTVLFDQASRPEFGPIAQNFLQGEDIKVEVSSYNASIGYKVKIGGLFPLGPSFGVDGNLIMSYSTFLRTFLDRRAGYIDIGLINLQENVDKNWVLENLKAKLPQDIRILTREDYIKFEKDYWSLRTPIGFVFSLMVVMGLVVGIVFVYQILYSNISSSLVAFATLKAMGFKHKYLLKVVFQQAFLLAVLGYIPGLIVAFGLYDIAKKATKLPVIMTLDKGILVLFSVTLMCLVSGFLAVQKLQSADPADIF